MRSVAEGFAAEEGRMGLSLGILPGEISSDRCRPPAGYPNRFVEFVVRTHLPGRGVDGGGGESRNILNVLSADALVILPGGTGTRSEALLALRFGKPVISYGPDVDGVPRADSLREVEDFLRRTVG